MNNLINLEILEFGRNFSNNYKKLGSSLNKLTNLKELYISDEFRREIVNELYLNYNIKKIEYH